MIIHFFGELAHILDKKTISISIESSITIREVLQMVISRYPLLNESLSLTIRGNSLESILIIVDQKIMTLDDFVDDNATITICPPISDG